MFLQRLCVASMDLSLLAASLLFESTVVPRPFLVASASVKSWSFLLRARIICSSFQLPDGQQAGNSSPPFNLRLRASSVTPSCRTQSRVLTHSCSLLQVESVDRSLEDRVALLEAAIAAKQQ